MELKYVHNNIISEKYLGSAVVGVMLIYSHACNRDSSSGQAII